MNDSDGSKELLQQIKIDTIFWNSGRLITVLLILIPVATIFGNTLVIVAVMRERSLHSVTNHLIVSLAFADFLINSYVWGLGAFMCNLYMATDVALSTASILNLLAISVDRYMAIAQPLLYAQSDTRWRRTKIMIFIVWVVSATVGLPILLGVNAHPDDVILSSNCFISSAVRKD
ncbi:unnamed protein product [Gongylonema pulchrum]|uniref:G_PROTEIN_RECEP_F1_2 domain-containing protein n=1 Tax=Gongylonema pulchrum TaxID=637853 RepID=A0A183CU90_9BILA|nr:unnamed protein product [Gongylonema pulchrum]